MSKIGLFRVLLTCLSVLVLFTSYAQIKKISGTVTDDKANALVGATVTVKGTNVITSTNSSGAFSIDVPGTGKVLVVSYVGMTPQEIAIGSQANVRINMVPTSATTLTDVVVVGYGTARKANLTTAQSTVSSKEIERTVNTTVEQAFQGRAPGVYVTQNSGQPGGGISVAIRGISSINGNTEPLYVIDGVQLRGGGTANSSNPLAGINPSDIEDIQILQGPSATAIYGSQATNGVIMITTKRGKSGDFKINYAYLYNLQTPPQSLDVM